MTRFITYVMALAVGIVIAVALGIPRNTGGPVPVAAGPHADEAFQPGAAEGYAVGNETAAAEGTDPAMALNLAPSPTEHQTILLVEIASGAVTINVNHKAVSTMDATTSFDLGPYVQPGKNTIWLKWDQPVEADIRISRSTAGDPFRDAGHAFLNAAGTQYPGSQPLIFFL